MKSYILSAAFFLIFCAFLFPGRAESSLNPDIPDAQTGGHELDSLFSVSVAKEPVHLILVEKNSQRLRVLEYDTELRTVADFPSATGENLGIKQISGDSKTPEGIYFITHIFRDDEITIFGDKAFHLDYPNFFDMEAGRNGDGIYIHGTNKKLEPNSTNGCITLANHDLDSLETYLDRMVTPVIIVPDLDYLAAAKTHLLTDNDFALAKSNLLTEDIKPDRVEYNYLYIINYDKQAVAVSDFNYRPFERSIMRGASRTYLEYLPEEGWVARKRIWRISPMQIYPESPVKVAVHPLEKGEVQLAAETETASSAMVAATVTPDIQNRPPAASRGKAANVAGEKPKDKSIAAVAGRTAKKNDIRPQPAARATELPTQAPVRTAVAKVAQQGKITVTSPPAVPRDKQQIRDFVERWRQAWTSQEIDPYIAFYDDSFRSGDKDLSAWKAHKANLNRIYEYINVNISDIKVSWTDGGATVSFLQEYRSDRYSATGRKTLYLKPSASGWKIRREVYSRI